MSHTVDGGNKRLSLGPEPLSFFHTGLATALFCLVYLPRCQDNVAGTVKLYTQKQLGHTHLKMVFLETPRPEPVR